MLKTLSLIGYLGMIGGLLGLLAMHAVFSPSAWVIAIQAAALLLGVWARITFGRRSYHVAANPTEGGLVTRGPYRYVRHPIYTAIFVATLAGITAHWSWQAGVCGGVVVGSLVMRILCEEKLLVARYPEYGRYAARTSRMIPYVY
ncbi:MAG TPA: isoprenylcysteine carboxylmethyltransferase family protein [Candidatus Acidoferrum sp.]|jgi:protein-S-isoprenylcysteine O-methyltransferase Ste14|nr:isoprenylcysteine carboxylmethyltransferase family protein [Candidatus Acidoferrum sp.]